MSESWLYLAAEKVAETIEFVCELSVALISEFHNIMMYRAKWLFTGDTFARRVTVPAWESG